MTETNDIINNITDDQILYIHTKKIPAIKSLIEALKEIFRDVNIKFTPKISKPSDTDPTKMNVTGGMYITALNSNSNILVRLHLEADKFCYYKCQPDNDKNYIMLGVNMSNLFKLIKFSIDFIELCCRLISIKIAVLIHVSKLFEIIILNL